MSWIIWLSLAVVIVALAAITGIKPKGTRHVANTRMMGVGRVVLFIVALIFVYVAFQARSGG
jgi:F0F1-type ATP synthase membrane subunit a